MLGRRQIVMMTMGSCSQKIRHFTIPLDPVRIGVMAFGEMQSEAQRAQRWRHPCQEDDDRQQHSTAGVHGRRILADDLDCVKRLFPSLHHGLPFERAAGSLGITLRLARHRFEPHQIDPLLLEAFGRARDDEKILEILADRDDHSPTDLELLE